jgi:hypothetical protein
MSSTPNSRRHFKLSECKNVRKFLENNLLTITKIPSTLYIKNLLCQSQEKIQGRLCSGKCGILILGIQKPKKEEKIHRYGGFFWIFITYKNCPLKVGTNENGSACGRWLSIGI